jgi:hypothetical protein
MKLLIALVLILVPAVSFADALPAPTLKLIAAGQAPRTQLRFTPKQGTKRTLVLTSQDSKARGLKGKLPPLEESPAIRTTIAVEVTEVNATGDVRYKFAYEKVEVVESKATKSSEAARQLNAALAVLVGLKGHAVVTNRGITKELELQVPPNATPQARNAIDAARSVLGQIAEPLPEEAVGIGAKWQSSTTVTAGELTAQSTVTHELVELAQTRAKVKITMTVHGKGSGDGNLTTDTSASGEKSLDLTSVVPSQAKLDLRTEVGLDADGKRLAQLSTTKLTVVGR